MTLRKIIMMLGLLKMVMKENKTTNEDLELINEFLDV